MQGPSAVSSARPNAKSYIFSEDKAIKAFLVSMFDKSEGAAATVLKKWVKGVSMAELNQGDLRSTGNPPAAMDFASQVFSNSLSESVLFECLDLLTL